MFKQEVKIQMVDKFSNNMGTLTIRPSNYKSKSCSTYYFKCLTLKNIPISNYVDDKTPIIYYNGFSSNLSKLMLLEETEYQILFESDDVNANFEVLHFLTKNNSRYFRKFDFELSDDNKFKLGGILNFRSYVGKSFLDIIKNGTNSVKIPIEVRSKKIDYLKQYSVMLSELSQHFLSLIFEIQSPLFQEFEFNENQKKTYYEDFMFLEFLFRDENLPAIFEYLTKNLHTQLKNHIETVPLFFASNVNNDTLKYIVSNPNNLIRSNNEFTFTKKLKGYLPKEIDQIKHEEIIDTPENRFFKYFLELVRNLIELLLDNPKSDYIKGRLLDFQDEIEYYLSNKSFKNISTMDYVPFNSQILQKKEGYREIFRYFLMLEFSFRLSWDEVNDQLKGFEKRLSELYEYWCYFKLLKVLNDLSVEKINFDDIFSINDDKWSIYIKKGRNSVKKFKIISNGVEVDVDLFYNLMFSKKSDKFISYSLIFKPDYTLRISVGKYSHYIHFDAKYRSNLDNLNDESEDDVDKRDDQEENRSIFKKGDIYKMHTYKDSILRSHGAYVLYPGNSSKKFLVWESHQIPSVGAFSLALGDENEDEDNLHNFIMNIIEILSYNQNYYIYEWSSESY